MTSFYEVMGQVFCVVLVIAVIGMVLVLISDTPVNRFCEKQGYATEIYIRGESYCVEFSDGILSRVGLLDFDRNGARIVGEEFLLVGGE